MKMSLSTILIGAILIVGTVLGCTVFITAFNPPAASDIARPLSAQEERGRQLYISNGCVNCHTQYVRPADWSGPGGSSAGRVSQPGDYAYEQGPLLGQQRIGPDLAQAGGVHPDDWHIAHLNNARYTQLYSVMPNYDYLSQTEQTDLIAYVQSLGGKAADVKTQVQKDAKQKLQTTTNGKQGAPGVADASIGYDQQHLDLLKSNVPNDFKELKSAVYPNSRSLLHGKAIFLQNCIGCHGQQGNGNGPAAQYLNPKPFNLTDANAQKQTSDGQIYYYILHSLPGSAMPSWGDYLSIQDIWDVVNFVRTIPNGGLTVDDSQLTSNLQVVKPAPSPFDSNADQWYERPPQVQPTPAPTRQPDFSDSVGSK